jgi:hypothetical protein
MGHAIVGELKTAERTMRGRRLFHGLATRRTSLQVRVQSVGCPHLDQFATLIQPPANDDAPSLFKKTQGEAASA